MRFDSSLLIQAFTVFFMIQPEFAYGEGVPLGSCPGQYTCMARAGGNTYYGHTRRR
ncbi:hypothetical protein PGTUg99_032061 [Puccinia graminis f. sp. tritici]|uniref:CBM1 domain-containing protein n=1 Tax=Puccinia graminis f. sp. tritici TaxID=56615 RepID=A0A5B0Q928_PUCGR|nr:hypothetical protein PGTUg99_032061 [Puccinia graminis f. sp. tritici]